MFSVIIPLYNKEISIANTIRSVLDQTFQNFEIVVVNDGSTDKSAEIVAAINDNRVRLIHQINKGVSAARNTGIREAKYDWVAFLDGDDLWGKDHLIEYFKAINIHTDLKWLISGYSSKMRNKARSYVYFKKGILENVFIDLLNGLKITTITVCVRKELFNIYSDLFFKEGVNNSEDREVWYKLGCIDTRPYYIKKCLAIYNINESNSLTGDKTNTRKDHFLSMIERLEEFQPYINLNQLNKNRLNRYIFQFNKGAIKNSYVNGIIKNEYKVYLTKFEFWLIKNTYKRNKYIKQLIIKYVL